MQSNKQNRERLKNAVSQSKPFNRLIEYGFTPQELQGIQKNKDEVLSELEKKLVEKENRLKDIEMNYKNGRYDKEQYAKLKKEAKEQVSIFKQKIKMVYVDECQMVLAKASPTLNHISESAMSSNLFPTDFIESKSKLLLPFLGDSGVVKDDKSYEDAWRNILKGEAHRFPAELLSSIKALESKRQAIQDLLSYYNVSNVRTIKNLKHSTLHMMLSNIDKLMNEYQKRLKDPKYDFKVRLREAVTNEGCKVVLTEFRKKQKAYKEIRKSLKEGEKKLNALKIDRPNDESRLFTPTVNLRFSTVRTQPSSNPLQLTSLTVDEVKNRRKSVHF